MNKVKIDVACGNNKKDGFLGIDIANTPSVDIVHDLNQYLWPIESNTVDEIYCSHYVEHIPHNVNNGNSQDGLIQFMNELYRIMKPGATAIITAPYYTSIRAFGDPTHVRFICDWTFNYYDQDWLEANKLAHYGITANFKNTISYYVTNEMILKSEEVRNNAFKKDWNVIDDIIVELIKK
jgi:predicted SAM-dependent methyltransferase